jgi:hypothetical protein
MTRYVFGVPQRAATTSGDRRAANTLLGAASRWLRPTAPTRTTALSAGATAVEPRATPCRHRVSTEQGLQSGCVRRDDEIFVATQAVAVVALRRSHAKVMAAPLAKAVRAPTARATAVVVAVLRRSEAVAAAAKAPAVAATCWGRAAGLQPAAEPLDATVATAQLAMSVGRVAARGTTAATRPAARAVAGLVAGSCLRHPRCRSTRARL